MQEYIITEQQLQGVLTVLLEMPAKLSLGAIDLLRHNLRLNETSIPEVKHETSAI